MDNKIGVRITMPAKPNFWINLMMSLLRRVNFRAGMNRGTLIFRALYPLTRSRWK
jgi:hypothetical protein